MRPSASNITMASAAPSRIAPSSSALAWPAAEGALATIEGEGALAVGAAPDSTSAKAGSPSQVMACSRAIAGAS